MMKQILLALICAPALLLAQAPDTVWTKTFGGTGVDQCFDCFQTSDGGFIMVGYTDWGAGKEDVWLIKTDSFGNVEWDVTYGLSMKVRMSSQSAATCKLLQSETIQVMTYRDIFLYSHC